MAARLPPHAQRLAERITGAVVDSIVIYPRSSGQLRMPGEFSRQHRPAACWVRITSTSTTNDGVDYELVQLGTAESYVELYEVNNHRDSPSFAELVLREDTTARGATSGADETGID